VHIILTLSYAVFIYSGKSYLRKEQIIPIFFVPIFGPIMAFVIELLNIYNKQGIKPVELEPLSLEDDILWVTLKSFHEKGDIVPLEEAILINDVKVRRRFMLETLYADPLKYLDILNIAKYNDDVETSHYATTTISKAQKDFQLSIQKLAVIVENNPDDLDSLSKYIETLEKYIESGLLEEHLLRNLRIVYSKILDKKLDHTNNDRNTMIKKLRNCIKLSEYNSAFEIGDYLIKNWPENERSWIESIRACVDGADGHKLQEILLSMRNEKINWTMDGKEQVKVWLQEPVQ
jgi:tetratricopeptide (TPR) repeat protein